MNKRPKDWLPETEEEFYDWEIEQQRRTVQRLEKKLTLERNYLIELMARQGREEKNFKPTLVVDNRPKRKGGVPKYVSRYPKKPTPPDAA